MKGERYDEGVDHGVFEEHGLWIQERDPVLGILKPSKERAKWTNGSFLFFIFAAVVE